MRPAGPLALALALALLPPIAHAADREVHLHSGFFEPSDLQVHAGERILFVNVDDRPHTVTSTWDEGAALDALLRPGDAVPIVFQQAGVYVLRCVPHSTHDDGDVTGMVAAVEVRAAAAEEPPVAWPIAALLAGAALILAFAVHRGARWLSPPRARTSPR